MTPSPPFRVLLRVTAKEPIIHRDWMFRKRKTYRCCLIDPQRGKAQVLMTNSQTPGQLGWRGISQYMRNEAGYPQVML